MKPTKGHHIVDYAATLKIEDDHVLICYSGLREGHIRRYFNDLLLDGGPKNEDLSIDLLKRADVKKINLIKEEGVKHIDLNLTLFEESIKHSGTKLPINTKFRNKVVETIKAYALKDRTRTELEESESLTAKITINVDGRKKDRGTLGYERLEDLAKSILDDGSDGYVIVTKKGKKIRADEISLSKSVKLHSDGGKAVLYNEAWSALKSYFKELQSNGTLEE